MFKFSKGEPVRIRDGFAHIGQPATIDEVSLDWSQMICYRLKEFPGWWPQSSLEKVTED